MPRLRQVPRAEVQDDLVLRMYEQLFPGRDPVAEPGTATGTPGDWWTVHALVPEVMRHAVRGFTFYASPDRVVDPQLRELGQTLAGWLVGSQFVFSQHCKSCRALGMPEEKIEAIPSWGVATCFTPAERAVLAYTEALVRGQGRIPDAVFAELQRHLTDEAILELTYITAMYVMHGLVTKALRVEFDDRDEACVEVAAPEDYDATRGIADIADPRPAS